MLILFSNHWLIYRLHDLGKKLRALISEIDAGAEGTAYTKHCDKYADHYFGHAMYSVIGEHLHMATILKERASNRFQLTCYRAVIGDCLQRP